MLNAFIYPSVEKIEDKDIFGESNKNIFKNKKIKEKKEKKVNKKIKKK